MLRACAPLVLCLLPTAPGPTPRRDARPRHLGLWRWREAPPLPAPASPTPHRPCAFPDALLYLLLYDSHISHFYALLYLVFAFRLFENNLCYSHYKMRYFFSNFVRKQNVESENFPINPINVFLGDLRFFLVTGKENLGRHTCRSPRKCFNYPASDH